MHRSMTLIAGLSLTASALAAANPAAAVHAGRALPACATHTQFLKIATGDTIARVRTLFHGLNGDLVWQDDVGGHHLTERAYPPCSPHGFVHVQYSDGKETHKYGYFPG